MSYNYAVIGAGRQGTASAYDFIKFGDAEKIILIDSQQSAVDRAVEKLKKLTGKNICTGVVLDINDEEALEKILKETDAIVSGVPYYYNHYLTEMAIKAGANFVDFGGNTDVVKEQLNLDEKAREADVSVIPDCGMDPGLNISLIMYIVDIFDSPASIKSYGAGLTQFPKPPWNFELTFHINGLTNEYFGDALFLRDGEVEGIPCLTELETIDFPDSLGQLEAAVTSGGLSTLPYTLKGKLKTLENKTLRYPGHWQQFKAFSDLGLFNTKKIEIGNCVISPREFYHKLIEKQITSETTKDIGIIRIFAEGIKNGRDSRYELELIDYYDPKTEFTAMQRLTGWHASMIAILANKGKVRKGAVSVENAVPGRDIKMEIEKRGIKITEKFE